MFILNSFIFTPPSSLNNGLMFVYKAENNANDSAGTNNGTPMGGLLYSSGKSNQSFIFNGTNAYVELQDNSFNFTEDFTASAWVNVSTLPSSNCGIVGNYTFGGQGGWGMYMNGGNLVAVIRNVGGNYYLGNTTSIFIPNQWTHVVMVFKKNIGFYIYGNGSLSGEQLATVNPNFGISPNPATKARIGLINYSGDWWWMPNNSRIDEVYIWNRALTATEVLDLYKCSLGNFYPFTITPSLDSDACAFVSASQISDTTQVNAINQLVLDLKSANLWSKMKAIYPLVGGTAEKHRWNLKNPSQYKIDWFGGGTHSSNGYLPNGLSYGNTNFIPTIDYSVNNSAHISFYSRTNSSEAQFNEMGCYQANYLVITLRRSDQSQNTFLFANTLSGINFFDSNSLGLYVSNRISNQANGYKNGVNKGSNTVTDNARNNLAVIIGANNSSNNNVTQYSNRECAFATIGDGLTDADATSFYNAVQAFQVALGGGRAV